MIVLRMICIEDDSTECYSIECYSIKDDSTECYICWCDSEASDMC